MNVNIYHNEYAWVQRLMHVLNKMVTIGTVVTTDV